MPPTRPLDGKNIWPALREGKPSPVESYYWVWHNEDAIRTMDWRLHRFFDHCELYDIRKDIGETTNVAEAHPDVVKALTGKMDAWAASLGAALTHQRVPAHLDAKPVPGEEVLEISVTVSEQAQPKDRMVIPFATYAGNVFATDYIEYDLAVAPGSLQGGFFYTPFKGNDNKALQFTFKRGEGIDQFGREQVLGPPPQGGPGAWEHRIIGLCSSAPGILPRHAMVFTGRKAGTFKVYLANLRLRHADGSTTPIWMSGRDTRARKIADTEHFKNVQVRVVASAGVQAK